MHPTQQELEDYIQAVYDHNVASKAWAEEAIEAVQNNRAIGSNPPSPPPPPPGTHH